ncbi:SCO family protein [Massilia horti]|uniref:SCO family protein n=1 Tax=Massilia horti TaxID=2562153 RepID=A0A4Y9SZU5_9BURK|nr:SCO family protein [Massilia horti]TFW32311.1 SCO family protein [Massilia horti]
MKVRIAVLVLASAAALAAAADPPAAFDGAAVRLQRADGTWTRLGDELENAGPAVLNFVFTSCSAICPIQSRVLAELQKKAVPGLRLFSISIDPLNDTPQRLRAYARSVGAGEGWRFYTGTPESSGAAQRAFGAYRGNKMNHEPVMFLRTRAGGPWQRIDGYASADQLLAALHERGAGR